MTTRVVSKYRTNRWDVSITRGTYKSRSKWGNPYPLRSREDLDVVECLLKHARYLRESGLIDDVHELRGQTLACVCAPARCHGDTLARCAGAADPRAELDDILEELEAERAKLDAQQSLI